LKGTSLFAAKDASMKRRIWYILAMILIVSAILGPLVALMRWSVE
jgi:hypothetical protein